MSLKKDPKRRDETSSLVRRAVASLPLLGLLAGGCGAYGGVPPTPGTSAEVCSRGTPSPGAVSIAFEELSSETRAHVYQGRRIRVQGYLTIGFEDTYLYDLNGTCEAAMTSGPKQKLGIAMSPYVSYRKICGDRLVTIEGIYDGEARGGYHSGLLRDVNFLVSAGPICRAPSAEGRNPPPPTIVDHTLPRSTR